MQFEANKLPLERAGWYKTNNGIVLYCHGKCHTNTNFIMEDSTGCLWIYSETGHWTGNRPSANTRRIEERLPDLTAFPKRQVKKKAEIQ